ncbi:MAG: DNA methyltransferase [Thaumarchaeota archaeon]|nr:DNA methyltransferase [Nitrososphaerota archaeon]
MDDNSIDYVITDPPHGDRQPYLELSMLWNTWLGFECDFENELVISNAKTRNKNVENYNKLLIKIISQIERVLKPGKYFTLMFNSLDNATWKNLQKTLYGMDMNIVDIATVDYSATSVVQDNRDVGLKTDFAFTFKKHQNNRKAGYRQVELEHLKEMTHSLMQQYSKRNDQARPYEILNYTVTSLMNDRIVFDLGIILKLLKKDVPIQ